MTREPKEQSGQGTTPGESATKIAQAVFLDTHLIAIVFWDSQGIILIDYWWNGKTVTGAYCAMLLSCLKELNEMA